MKFFGFFFKQATHCSTCLSTKSSEKKTLKVWFLLFVLKWKKPLAKASSVSQKVLNTTVLQNNILKIRHLIYISIIHHSVYLLNVLKSVNKKASLGKSGTVLFENSVLSRVDVDLFTLSNVDTGHSRDREFFLEVCKYIYICDSRVDMSLCYSTFSLTVTPLTFLRTPAWTFHSSVIISLSRIVFTVLFSIQGQESYSYHTPTHEQVHL